MIFFQVLSPTVGDIQRGIHRCYDPGQRIGRGKPDEETFPVILRSQSGLSQLDVFRLPAMGITDIGPLVALDPERKTFINIRISPAGRIGDNFYILVGT